MNPYNIIFLGVSLRGGTVSNPLKGHNGTVRVVKCCPFDESGAICASAGAGDFRTRIWDLQTGEQFPLC